MKFIKIAILAVSLLTSPLVLAGEVSCPPKGCSYGEQLDSSMSLKRQVLPISYFLGGDYDHKCELENLIYNIKSEFSVERIACLQFQVSILNGEKDIPVDTYLAPKEQQVKLLENNKIFVCYERNSDLTHSVLDLKDDDIREVCDNAGLVDKPKVSHVSFDGEYPMDVIYERQTN